MSLPGPLWYVDLLYTPVKNTSCCFPHQNWGPGGVGSCLLTQGGTGRAWPGTSVIAWWHCLLRGFAESCARGSLPRYLTQEHPFLQSSVPCSGHLPPAGMFQLRYSWTTPGTLFCPSLVCKSCWCYRSKQPPSALCHTVFSFSGRCKQDNVRGWSGTCHHCLSLQCPGEQRLDLM